MTEGGGPRPPAGTRREPPEAPDETQREAPSPFDATLPESSAAADATRAEEAPLAHPAAPPFATGFPEELATRFRPVRELDHGSQADVWLVEDDAGTPFVAKVFRPGFEGRRDILEILHGLEPNRDIVPVVSHGRADGRLYVVLEYVPGGNLRGLMQPGVPASTDLVREVLTQLVSALERLHGKGIEHQDLKPGNVLVRSRQPLDLVLADFGVATQASETVRATRLAGMTWAYAPPEAFSLQREELMLWRGKYDAWALGVIVVELLTGRHPLPGSEAAIATFFVTRGTDDLVVGVDDPAWRKLCRGLLRRDPEARWGTAEARRWLEAPDAPDLDVKDEAAPATTPLRGFRVKDRDYATAADLGSAMAGDWAMAEDVWRYRTPELLQWLRHELGTPDVAARLEEIDRTPGLDLDAQLFWAIRALAPRSRPSFRGESLTAENLARVASRAAARPDGADAGLLVMLHDIPRLGGPGDPALTAQMARWSGAAAAWGALRGEHAELPELSSTEQKLLLAAATEGSGVTEQLRERTRDVLAKWPRARKSDWFRRLGAVRRAEGPQLLAMALLAGQAHDEVEADVRASRKTRWLGIGAGATSGLAFSLLCLFFKGLMLEYDDWVALWDDSASFLGPTIAVLAMLAGGATVLIWVLGRSLVALDLANPFYNCLLILCGSPLLLLAVFSLTYFFLYGLFGSAMILSYTIPGPFFLAPGFALVICMAIGIGLGMARDVLNLKETVTTRETLNRLILDTLVITLCVILMCAAIGAARFPGYLGALFGEWG